MPDRAQLYVTMTDTLLTAANRSDGRRLKLVVTCDDEDEASRARDLARRLPGMRAVNVLKNYPKYPSSEFKVSVMAFRDIEPTWRRTVGEA